MTETKLIKVGTYEVGQEIGRGGTSVVFAARSAAPNILGTFAMKRALKARGDVHTVDEGKIGLLLRHPNLVGVHEIIVEDDVTWLVMDRIHGKTLNQVIAARTGEWHGQSFIDPLIITEILLQMTYGLRQLHTQKNNGESLNAVHRDLKPSNVFVTNGGAVKVFDFGHASFDGCEYVATVGEVSGTPAYMAPEQLISGKASVRTDIFTVGTLLFELVIGTYAFVGTEVDHTIHTGSGSTSKRSVVDRTISNVLGDHGELIQDVCDQFPRFGAILHKCWQPLSEDRYQSMGEVTEALSQLQQQLKEERGVTGIPVNLARWLKDTPNPRR